jgi:hypothetical protein
MLTQGPYTPRLVWHGPVIGDEYMLVTTRVFGRQLRTGGIDARYFPKALAALRAVHAAGYLVSTEDLGMTLLQHCCSRHLLRIAAIMR